MSIVGTDLQSLTDARGQFVLVDVPPGGRVLRVDRIGYGDVVHALDVPSGRVIEARLELVPEAIVMDPIIVTAIRHPKLQVRGFYERRDWSEKVGLGEFITEEEIKNWPAARLSALVSRVPMVRTVNLCPGGAGGAITGPAGGRGGRCSDYVVLSTSSGRWARVGQSYVRVPCPADVWIDGMRARLFSWGPGNKLILRSGINELGIPSEVAGIEVYRRASELPAEFSGATDGCGAVVIWTS